ncbi:hypothetical protein OXYTRIMIC_224 [Oxytricha trifallax]|uniref:Uncharacterized protein n=1 Tax=Oxytricha trifallax TaxID=1172189 RepID=A0A073IB26_9SPIT|nr:hypothetical protein OXYTRIMIC_224 [Oxytricha trifallax]
MESLSIVEKEVLINDLMKYALDEQMEEKEYICPYCNAAYATSQTRANHWNKSKKCRLYHKVQRAEDLLQNLICLGCGVSYGTFYNCQRHMNECNRVDKASIPKQQIIYDEKVLDQWNYGEMKFQKKLLDPKQSELQLPEFIYELKNGYISAKWLSYFKQQFINGLPIKLRSDVRNDFFWNNLKITMLKLIGSLFKIVVQDNPWKVQRELPYQYLCCSDRQHPPHPIPGPHPPQIPYFK